MTGAPAPCPAALLDRMRDEVRRSGFTFVNGEATKLLLTSESIESWDAFAESWDGLGADQYMAGGGSYRRRCHAVFSLRPGVLLRREHQHGCSVVELHNRHRPHSTLGKATPNEAYEDEIEQKKAA
ncbi:MAG TPA: hypothetical protein PKV67_00515 [Hyphomonas sp.]|nr:hypothetical protein [Hyphomonas sp.]HRI99229.1 hypothetical protein [Hyphomonas sp.]HRK67177.1 hypothetical protein [Hyphomonas sp.]